MVSRMNYSSEGGETLFKQAFLLTGNLQKQRPAVPVHLEMEKNRQWGCLPSQAMLSRIGSPESRIGGDPVLCWKTERGPHRGDC